MSPRTEERSDLRAAMQCVTFAKAMGNKTAKLSDFQIKFDNEVKKKSGSEIALKLKVLNNMVKKVNSNGNNRST